MFAMQLSFGVLMVLAGDPGTNRGDSSSASSFAASTTQAPWAQIDCAAGPELAGKVLEVKILVREAPDNLQWQFGCGVQRLAQGEVKLDAVGHASVEIELPLVRSRTVFSFTLLGGEKKISRKIVVYAKKVLNDAAKKIAKLQLGVIDDAGLVAKALQAEGVGCDNLKSTLGRDSFLGGAVILANIGDKDSWSDLCDRFDSRLRKGMSIVLLNPPAGWKHWGLSCEKMQKPIKKPVQLSDIIATWLHADDITAGPWQQHCKAGEDVAVESLAWFIVPGEKTESDEGPADHKLSLIIQRKLGRGKIIVAVMPQLNKPASDAVGRRLLCELVRAVLPADKEQKEKGS